MNHTFSINLALIRSDKIKSQIISIAQKSYGYNLENRILSFSDIEAFKKISEIL
jgi:hypothetical protein